MIVQYVIVNSTDEGHSWACLTEVYATKDEALKAAPLSGHSKVIEVSALSLVAEKVGDA